MSKGVNRVILLGNVGKDPDVRSLPDGTTVTTISVATSESWTDKQTGERKENTEWHRVVFFKRLAEIAGEYLRKGSKVYIEGQLRTRKWQDKDGSDRYTTEIVAREMQMLDSKGEGGHQQAQRPYAGRTEVDQRQARASTKFQEPVPAAEDWNDDIPF